MIKKIEKLCNSSHFKSLELLASVQVVVSFTVAASITTTTMSTGRQVASVVVTVAIIIVSIMTVSASLKQGRCLSN